MMWTATITKSRKEARKLMRRAYPDVNWYTHYVHHIDGNPLNNEYYNLKIVPRECHTALHKIQRRKGNSYVHREEICGEV